MITVCKEIAQQLYNKYYKYYCYVYFDFITEAVENTIKDFYGEVKPLEDIHEHIKQNYI